MSVTDEELEVLLIEVDQTLIGAAVRTDNPAGLRQRLYPVMKACGLDFKLRIPAVEGELWLIKKPTIQL